mgnify:CR=1 FL=1
MYFHVLDAWLYRFADQPIFSGLVAIPQPPWG